MRIELVRTQAPSIWTCCFVAGERTTRPDPFNLINAVDPPVRESALINCTFRGVSLDRLGHVLAHGIDIWPTDDVIYTSFFDKAWEYGDFPKVILALDQRQLSQTFRVVPASTPEHELAELVQTFPTCLRIQDGSKLWLSRLDRDDPRIGSSYEMEYANWIPGNALECLQGVFIFTPEADEARIRAYFNKS